MKSSKLRYYAFLISLPLVAEAQIRVNSPETIQARAGDEVVARVNIVLADDWFIYGPIDGFEFNDIVLASIDFPKNPNVQTAPASFPKPEFLDGYPVLFGPVIEVTVPVRVRHQSIGGLYDINGVIRLQACNGMICLPPQSEDVRLTFRIID